MSRPRMPLVGPMVVVLFFAVRIAALRNASETRLRNGRRACWVGFALFGWGYLPLTSSDEAAHHAKLHPKHRPWEGFRLTPAGNGWHRPKVGRKA